MTTEEPLPTEEAALEEEVVEEVVREEEMVPIFEQISSMGAKDAVVYAERMRKELEERGTDGYEDSEADLCLLRQAVEAIPVVDGNEHEIAKCKELLDAYTEKTCVVASPSGDRPKKPIAGVGGLGYETKETASVWGTPFRRRVETAAVVMFNFFTGLPMFLLAFLLLFLIPLMWPFLFVYVVYMVFDSRRATTPRRYWPSFRRLVFWKFFASYFPVRLRIETPEKFTKVYNDEAAHYLLIVHPHGVHSFGAVINFSSNANGLDDRLPELFLSVQTLSIQFWLPLWREIVRIGSMGNASRKTLMNLLRGKPGDSALLVVGGAEESLDAAPGTSKLILKKRKGFVRIALQTGAALVPCFSFGENDTYRSVNPSPETRSKLKWIQTKLGFAIPLFMGRGIFNYTFGFLPHRRQITSVVGEPIRVQKWEGEWDLKDPKLQQAVDDLHRQYMEALQDLYDRNKNIHDLSRTAEMRFTQ
eukprot:TRINITY_DN3193_c0_g1_i2.p1 TRINITY_DN3193_c0_g1~~TRINITY_DN3193_c0_g1_i2.p1  ORF type:complete len:490 (+),score=139.71 TRINITY_DN3193_c0_g1_i2:50-1471(+)